MKEKNIVASKRRYPPEWEKQASTWLSWPHNKNEWENRRDGETAKGRLEKIKRFYEELISTILDFQNVNLILANEELLKEIENIPTKKKHKCKKIIIPNNDIWIRDYGPFFVGATGRLPLLLDFEFNSWGEKFPPWDLDNEVPKHIALYLGEEIESYPIVLEGGAVEFSGNGLVLTTEQCLLNQNRNPNLSKNEIEKYLKSAFNIEEVLWLKQGLEGDHTDGHIDNIARFIESEKVLINEQTNKEDIRLLKDKDLKLTELPLPMVKHNGKKLPASYLNFIFINGGVIVPTFNCESDKKALDIFKKIFKDRKVIRIDCSLLIQEGGGLHCMTKQEPLF